MLAVKLDLPLGQGENDGNLQETKAAVRPALWGAVAEAIALAIVGFSWGGWVTVAAETLARNSAATAVVAALTPICVEKCLTMPLDADDGKEVALGLVILRIGTIS